MELKDFDKLCKWHFENSAVLHEIAKVFEERDKLREITPELYKACKEALESRNMQISWNTLKKIQQALVKADDIGGR